MVSSTQTPFLPPPSLQTSLRQACKTHPSQPDHLHLLALETVHNLRHQHTWANLRLHNLSPVTSHPLPRPLVSGLPPRRIYVHPDHQIEALKEGLSEKDFHPEREWVLPTRLREKWSLQKFAEVFDAITDDPVAEGEGVEIISEPEQSSDVHPLAETTEPQPAGARKARVAKRLLLATVGDDSTVVYYIVHDGVVKPRQN